MAHLIYYAFDMHRGPRAIPVVEITPARVINRLRRHDHAAGVISLLNRIAEEGAFPHLASAVNHSKHRGVIRAGLNERLRSICANRYAVVLPSFEFRGRGKSVSYPQVEFFEFFGTEADRLSVLMLQLGTELNRALSIHFPDSNGALRHSAARRPQL